ncbi:hypothetical protein [Pseudothioclava nitratireducens]|uniref:hypothetical protein n=1 Tax=Pseudothioclava nitratireducens TaxID=1928646 RepID=UPI0023DC6EDA|nr:hypothetical protein [Defluviimonas nitratireducens]MDF1618987.1 hypothetical protein [Defluviimonas nitratireducens]
MIRLAALTAIATLVAGSALAQTSFTPGAQFMEQWDLDSDGRVTLAEAREQRENIFYMFDQDSDGRFSAEELAGVDEHKALEREAGKGPGHNQPQMRGQGMGPGRGQGGMGPGQGQGRMTQQGPMGMPGFDMPAAEGMRLFDANRDGTITQAEFVAGTDQWFAMRDRNGDGTLTPADFGPGR